MVVAAYQDKGELRLARFGKDKPGEISSPKTTAKWIPPGPVLAYVVCIVE